MDNEQDEIVTLNPDRALTRAQWRALRTDPDEMDRLERFVQSQIMEPGGPTSLVRMMAPHGKPALLLLQAMDLADGWQARMAKDYAPEGETNSSIEAAKAGNLPWLTWLARHGANLQWKDHVGHNLAGHLYAPGAFKHMLWNPIGSQERTAAFVQKWIEQQTKVVQWLEGTTARRELLEAKAGKGNMRHRLVENLERLSQDAVVKHHAGIRAALLAANAHLAKDRGNEPKKAIGSKM
jgi:hypothetical protein